MKTVAFIGFLALFALVNGDDKAPAKEEDKSKTEVTKRGLLHSHTLNSGIDVSSASTLGTVLTGSKTFGGGIIDGGGIVVDDTYAHGTTDGIIFGGGYNTHGNHHIHGAGLCDHGVIHGDSHHFDLGSSYINHHHHHIPSTPLVQTLKIERPVAVPVHQNFKVLVDRPVPVPHPVPVPYKVHVPKPYGVPVEKNVEYEVIKHVPVEVEQRVPYIVKKLVPYPVERRIPYPVHIPVHRPVHVHEPKPYPVVLTRRVPHIVDKSVPFPVKVKEEITVPHPVPYDVPRPYPVKVPHPVPVHVDRPVAVHVPKPVPVHVTQHVSVPVPHPVPISVIKHVHVPVEETVHVPVSVHKDVHVNIPFSHDGLIHKTTFDPNVFIHHNPVAIQSFAKEGFLTHALPTALPSIVSTPSSFISGSTISSHPLISANGVKYTGNGFSFGTKFGSSLIPSDIGAHGSFDTNYFFPSSTVKPDFDIRLESQTRSDLNAFNVPLTVKVSRSSEESKEKSEEHESSKDDAKKDNA